MRPWIFVGMLFLSATPAAAGDDTAAAARGAVCSTITDSLQRLTCFDRAFPKSTEPDQVSSAISDTLGGTGAWQVTVDKSAIDDSPKVIAVLVPTEGGGALGRAGLLIRCIENTTSVVIVTDDFNIGADTAAITLRLDDAPAQATRWGMSDNGQSLGLWNGGTAIPFLKDLKTAKRLAVRVQMNRQSDLSFDLAGASAVVDQVAAACKWPAIK